MHYYTIHESFKRRHYSLTHLFLEIHVDCENCSDTNDIIGTTIFSSQSAEVSKGSPDRRGHQPRISSYVHTYCV